MDDTVGSSADRHTVPDMPDMPDPPHLSGTCAAPSMLLRWTVTVPGRTPRHVTVTGGTEQTAQEVTDLLRHVLDAPAAGLCIDGDPVPADTALGTPPLLDGARLALLPTATRPDPVPVPFTQRTTFAGRGVPARSASMTSRDGAPLQLAVISGPAAGLRLPLTPGRHTLGRDDDCDLRVDDPGLSRFHAVIEVGPTGVTLQDTGSTNGTRVDDTPVGAVPVRVTTASRLRVASSTLVLRTQLTRPAVTRATGQGTVIPTRGSRIRPPGGAPRIDLPVRPAPPNPARIPWLAMLLPVPIAAVLAVLLGPHMLLFAIMSPVLIGGSAASERLGARRRHRRELDRYAADLSAAYRRIAEEIEAERANRELALPDADRTRGIAAGVGHRIWERRQHDEDHLVVRLGCGPVPARLRVAGADLAQVSRWRFVTPDSGGTAHGGPDARHPLIESGPVAVDLARQGALGIAVGAAGPAVLDHLVGQLAVLCSPAELRMSIVCADPVRAADLRLIPHVDRLDADSRPAIEAARALIQARRAAVGPSAGTPTDGTAAAAPPVLLVIYPQTEAAAVPGLREVIDTGADVGVHLVIGASGPATLPTGCHSLLTGPPDGSAAERLPAVQLRCHDRTPVAPVVLDLVPHRWRQAVCQAVAPLRDVAAADDGTAGLPRQVWLSDLDDETGQDPVARVRHRWHHQLPGLAAPLGRDSRGAFLLDLVADGPHLLVGGTTGSGKSELLRTLITSVATHHPPDAVAFVLVDYKGGAAFGPCADLPHTLGLVTDLDDQLTARALTSLRAELRRREEVLRAAAAPDLPAYQQARRHGDPPLPRLVIVIDEFRMLAEELPDFIAGMVRIAAVGRSLGVHLVLATQRPGGIVSADIRANVNGRVALRVRDRVDSVDVIDTDHAHRIDPTTPGRAFLRTGGGDLVEIQTARVGTRSPESGPVLAAALTDPYGVPIGPSAPGHRGAVRPGPPDHCPEAAPEGFGSIVATLRAAARQDGRSAGPRPWQPPLPQRIPTGTGPAESWALLDAPATQCQQWLTAPVGNGQHWVVSGRPRSGRTTTLRAMAAAIAAAHSPDRAQLYAIHPGDPALLSLGALAHCGAVVAMDDPDRIERLLSVLAERVAQRRAQAAADSAAIHLLVDGWDRLGQLGDGPDRGHAQEAVLDLMRDGAGAGLSVVVAGGREVLLGRLATLVEHRLVLPVADPSDALLAGLRASDIPRPASPGRAVRVVDAAHLQVVDVGTDDLHPRADAAETSLPTVVPRVEPMPTVLPLGREHLARWQIGVGGGVLSPVEHDPARHGRRMLVTGPPGAGRTTALAGLGRCLLHQGHRVVVVLPGGRGETPPRAWAALARGTPGLVQVLGPEDAATLADLRRRHRGMALLVDDVDRLRPGELADVVGALVQVVDRDEGFVALAGSVEAAAGAVRGPVAEVARARTGIVLGRAGPLDNEIFGLRLPRLVHTPAGRGLLVHDRRATPIHVGVPADAA